VVTTVLSPDQRLALVGLARAGARSRVLRLPLPAPPGTGYPVASGVFVTLTMDGRLRGCLGTLECRAPLPIEVVRCAGDAATRDPRFDPVSPPELDLLAVEVSVLGPLEPVDLADEGAILVGTHGLVVESGARRGLLLPQVAPAWRWTPGEFLAHTCLKAGLPRDAWRRGAAVYRFTADVFGEP
jgi:AmmeMemoRadiSam system protein A